MGKAKLNVWLRDRRCRILDNSYGYLYLNNCCDDDPFPVVIIQDGNAEVNIPPGCYKVYAVVFDQNHQYPIYKTGQIMVIVNCGDHACVNIIIPSIEVNAAHLIQTFGVHAIRKNIDPKEIFEALIETSDVDRKQLIDSIENDIRVLREGLDEIRKASPKEEKEAIQYMKILEKIKNMID